MKILQLVTKRQYRGAEVFAYNLSKQLLAEGHEVIFAGLYQNDDKVLELDGAVNTDLSPKKTGYFSLKTAWRLIKLIQKEQPDIIQSNGSDTLKYAVYASFFFPKIPVLYRNISMISKWFNHPLKKRFNQILFKRVSFVTSVGTFAANDFIKSLNYPAERVQVIRRGIPLIEVDKNNSRQILIRQFNLNRDDKTVVHIGNFSPEKNHRFLLDVFERLKTKNPNIKLILVGKGVLFKDIEAEIKGRNLQDTVFLTGFRKDIPYILAGADLFVLSSLVEGVPGVILEAGAQKVPSVAIDVGGVSEVLINGKTGILLPDFDKDKFEQAVLNLLQNDTLRLQMGENAYDLVKNNFNNAQSGKKFIELYQNLLRKSI